MSAYALYRLPHADLYTQIQGETGECMSCTQLNGQSGFVIAPFEVKEGQPIVLIRPDSVSSHRLVQPTTHLTSHAFNNSDVSREYRLDYTNFYSHLERGEFQKIVLSRRADEIPSEPIDPVDLFHRACQLYPRMFIALVHTPQSGTWLTATPEILLEGCGREWRTIALAGTMKLEDKQLEGEGECVLWSIKNIKEQRVVVTYIAKCLKQFTGDFHEEGPRTVRAANLVHLRSDFTFTLPSDDCIGELLQQLHPTPAVCGIPKREAFEFIIHNEHSSRRYYSGFMGPVNLSPGTTSLSPLTSLYVSLRCMNIEDSCYHLYAGGGLMLDSNLGREWDETEAKLETMRKCIAIKEM